MFKVAVPRDFLSLLWGRVETMWSFSVRMLSGSWWLVLITLIILRLTHQISPPPQTDLVVLYVLITREHFSVFPPHPPILPSSPFSSSLSHVAAFLFPDDAVNGSYQPVLGCSSHKAVGGWDGGGETEGTTACHRESRAIQHLPVQCQQLLCSRLWYPYYYQQIQWEEWWAFGCLIASQGPSPSFSYGHIENDIYVLLQVVVSHVTLSLLQVGSLSVYKMSVCEFSLPLF